MKLEYIEEGDEFCPLIRLYQFDKLEIEELRQCINALISGHKSAIAIHELPFVQSISDIQLFFEIGKKDKGLNGDNMGKLFRCILTKEGWLEVFEFIEPSIKDLSGDCYQWLNRNGEVSLLLSPSGDW